jgi:hypothetical protein
MGIFRHWYLRALVSVLVAAGIVPPDEAAIADFVVNSAVVYIGLTLLVYSTQHMASSVR